MHESSFFFCVIFWFWNWREFNVIFRFWKLMRILRDFPFWKLTLILRDFLVLKLTRIWHYFLVLKLTRILPDLFWNFDADSTWFSGFEIDADSTWYSLTQKFTYISVNTFWSWTHRWGCNVYEWINWVSLRIL